MRFEYVHNLRGFTILLILLAHAIAVLPSTENISSLRLLMLNSSVIFIVIAGFLFALISQRYTYKTYLINKFKNVVLPYFFLSLPAACIYIFGYKNTHSWIDMESFNQLSTITKYLYLMLTGAHLGPLWFIPMVLVFYLLFPYFVFLLGVKKINFTLILITSLCIGMYVGRPENNDNTMQSFLYFLPAYLWGFMLYRIPNIIEFFKKYSLILCALFIFLLPIFYDINSYSSALDLPIKIIFATLLYSFFSHYLDRKINAFNLLAQVSFFLYFIHGYFAGGFRMYFGSNTIEINSYLLLVGVFGSILAASLLSFYILKPFVGKYKRQLLAVS
mgnify:CR=1 FL=1